MNAIVVVGSNWGIGQGGNLLFDLPSDLKRFRQLTMGSTMVMGYHTLLSLPGGKSLPGRENIVISTHNLEIPGATLVKSPAQALELVAGRDNVFVIGGGSIYVSLLPHCEKVFVTKVDAAQPSDTYFPNLDKCTDWRELSSSEYLEENGLRFRYVEYGNVTRT